MTSCDALRRLVSPYLDGELVAEDRAAFEAHVRECEACARSLDQERLVVAAVQDALPIYEAPADLRTRVQGFVNTSRPRHATRDREGWSSLGRPVVLAASLAACVLAAAALLRAPKAPPPERPAGAFAALAVDTHLRHERGQLPLEVRSEAAPEVSRFFARRVPFHLTLPDYPLDPGEKKPYRLEGGRLVSFGGDYAAYVAYRMEERPISMLVTSAERVRPEGGEVVTSGGITFHLELVSGLKVITWSDKGLTYALASDLAMTGSRSCMVCHGSADQRRKLEGL